MLKEFFLSLFQRKPAAQGYPRVLDCGDRALTVEFGNTVDPELNRQVRALDHALRGVAGIVETIPSFRSLFVEYDPFAIDRAQLAQLITGCLKNPAAIGGESEKIIDIPVCYGGEFGPDLADVAAHTGLSEEEVIKRHSQNNYPIYMLGFMPGFAYLGGLDPQLSTPRLKSPRQEIPAGSVGIAGMQTGIYPLKSPGGWRLIGRTPLKVYDPSRPEPFLYAAGDVIRFKAIDEAEYRRIQEQQS